MKAIKRVLSFGIVVLLICGTLSAYASEERKSGLFTYALKGNGTAVITKFDWDANNGKDVFIPKFIDGYTVTAIGDSTFARYRIDETRYVSDFLQSDDSKYSVSVTLPDSIVSLGNLAFAFTNIDKINIPKSVETIGGGAFVSCHKTAINLEPNHPYFAFVDHALYHKPSKTLIAYLNPPSNFLNIGGAVEYDFVVPNGILSIGDYAFYDCSIQSPMGWDSNFKQLPDRSNLLQSGIKSIGAYAFAGVQGNTSFNHNYSHDYSAMPNTIPDTVIEIGEGAFSASTTFTYDNSYKDSWRKDKIHDVKIGANSALRAIPDYAFCWNLATKEWPYNFSEDVIFIENSNITSIGKFAFENVTHINFAETSAVVSVGDYAFSKVWTFDSFEFPDNLAVLSKGMFFGSRIGSWLADNGNKLPEAVRTIESEAFLMPMYGDIKDLYLPSGITSIALDAFEKDATFVVEEGSYAERWARENGFGYKYPSGGGDNLDWLKND